MQPERQRPVPTATVLLAIALTMSGALVYLVPAIAIHTNPDRTAIALAIPLGIALAWAVSRSPGWHWIVMFLLASWSAVTSILFLAIHDNFNPSPLTVFVWTSGIVLLIVLTSVVFVSCLGRFRGERRTSPFFLFAFFFLGGTVGVGVNQVLERSEHVTWIMGLLVCTQLVFLGAYASFELTDAVDAPINSPAPTWLRRLRWMLLGGLPACAMLGVTSYVAAEISPIPFFWVLPLLFYQIAWVFAFARMTPWPWNVASWLVQVLACLALLPLVVLLRRIESREGDSLLWLPLFVMLSPFLLPHRLTLVAQSSLLSVVLLQIFTKVEFPVTPAILIHLSACVLACWGCHGDAVKDAPDADRLPEFLLFTQGGAIVFGIAFLVLPPILFPRWPIEYPLALAACLVLRSLPWPWPGARKSPAAERPPGFE